MNRFLYDICIVGGLSHVGLPLGIAFANAGKRVVLNDINVAAIAEVSNGIIPFIEKDAEEMLGSVLECFDKNISIEGS